MRRTPALAIRGAALLLAGVLAACSDGGAPTAAPQQDPLVEQLVAMGAKREHIADRGDHFVVEGDIVVYKKDLRAAPPRDGRAHAGQPQYQRYTSTVADNRRVVRVNLAALDAENASWAAATRAAMSNWSNVPDAHISYIEGSPADVTVSFVDYLSGTCTVALGAYPAGGAPGATVQVSRVYASTYSYAKQVWIMTHELGHNIGLTHTDQTFGTFIPNTVDHDPGSVMNSGDFFGGCPQGGGHIQAPDWAGFSGYDQIATRYLYPLPKPVLSVTNVGGTPQVNWAALSGATSYSVVFYVNWLYSNKATGEHINTEDPYPLGTTTGTSWLDTGRTYTGVTFCDWSYGWETSRESYKYHVTAHFPTGTSFAFVAAPVGEC